MRNHWSLNEADLPGAVAEMCRREPRFRRVIERHGQPSLRAMPAGFDSLLRIVTEQFLSLKAAHVIWLRLEGRLAPFTNEAVLACPHEELMRLGLSGAKARSFHGIARLLMETPRLLDDLEGMDDDAARKVLLALPGVGPWTADIYLLSALLRRDVWPWGDLALRQAAAELFSLGAPPEVRAMRALGETFSPWRAVAARLLWSHYRGMKGLAQAT